MQKDTDNNENETDSQEQQEFANVPEQLTTNSENNLVNTSDMEVHHHGHIHSKNRWKEYIFQFFMLFFAVFCGFLAEYQLEHKIERDREKIYMRSMIEDLVADTAEFGSKLKALDSMFYPFFDKGLDLLYSHDMSDSVISQLYETVPKCIRFMEVQFEFRTKIQLMNSGNLRLIRNEQVTDSLASYWKACLNIEDPILIGYAETRSKAKWALHELFEFAYFEEYSPMRPLKKNVQPKLVEADSKKLTALANHIANLHSQAKGPLSDALHKTNEKARTLITLIKKEYRLE